MAAEVMASEIGDFPSGCDSGASREGSITGAEDSAGTWDPGLSRRPASRSCRGCGLQGTSGSPSEGTQVPSGEPPEGAYG
jgi:hypothetical protein